MSWHLSRPVGLQGRTRERRDGGLQRKHQRGSPGEWGLPQTGDLGVLVGLGAPHQGLRRERCNPWISVSQPSHWAGLPEPPSLVCSPSASHGAASRQTVPLIWPPGGLALHRGLSGPFSRLWVSEPSSTLWGVGPARVLGPISLVHTLPLPMAASVFLTQFSLLCQFYHISSYGTHPLKQGLSSSALLSFGAG